MRARSLTTKIAAITAVIATMTLPACSQQEKLTLGQAREIAHEAFVYGYPMVDSYRIIYAYHLMPGNPEYKAALNEIANIPRVYTPEDRAVQAPNSDTPYSFVGLDLRSEPIVLGVPAVEKNRYYSIQLIDAYTHNFAYIGSRATGNDAGYFLVAGPDWKSAKPEGIKDVIRAETNLVVAIYRTQLFNPEDLENVKKIQDHYVVETLSDFLETAPPLKPQTNFIKPIELKGSDTSLEFFNVLNFVLEFCPTVPSETDLMARFAKIDVGPGKDFKPDNFSPEELAAIKDGIAEGWESYETFKREHMDTGNIGSGEVFGTRAHLNNNYLYRMAAAVMGIWGNSKKEAMYPTYTVDAKGNKLDATNKRYTLRFPPAQLPPVHAFWSVTMYELPTNLLTPNPINRYLINSPMLKDLKRDDDGGITLYIQSTSPGKALEPNWLPAPKGPFWVALRLYWPKDEALKGTWKAPPIKVNEKG